MKKYKVMCILLCIFLLTGMIPASATEAEQQDIIEDLSVSKGYHSIDANYAMLGSGQLVDNVKTAFLYEVNSDTLMYAWNPDARQDPASFVKIMTALIAIEQGTLTDAVTVKESVIKSITSSSAKSSNLLPNEVLTLEDLLYCMMVDSGNDAAAVIADHVGGSEAAFVEMMNAKALALGCTNTQYANPHGLPSENQYTTVRDTVRILAAAIQNEKFAEIFGTVYYTVPKTNLPESEERNLVSGNHLICQDEWQIYYDERVVGGRTGSDAEGRQCLAAVAESNGMCLISVVMGSESIYLDNGVLDVYGGYNETRTLLDTGFNGYKSVQLLFDGQVLLQRDVTDGANKVSLGVRVSASTVLPEEVTLSQLSFRYTNMDEAVNAPVKKGDILCSVEVWYGGFCVAQADLYAMNNVQKAGNLLLARQHVTPVWLIILLVLVGVVIVAVCAFLLLRYRRKIRRVFIRFSRKRKQRRRGY